MSETIIYEDDINHLTNFLRWILQIIGAWPMPASSSISTQIACIIRIIITYTLLLVTLLSNILHMLLKEKNIRKKIKAFGPALNSIMQLAKYTILLYQMKDVRRSFDVIRQNWLNANAEDRQVLRSKAETGRRLLLISMIFMFGSGLCYRTIVPLIRGPIVTPANVTVRPLGYPVFFVLINEQESPFYEIIFVQQFLSGFATYCIVSGSCGVAAFLVLHVCSQFRILINRIEKLTEKELDDRTVQLKLAAIISYQSRIKQFVNDVVAIIQYICFLETMGCTFLICLAGFCMVMEWESSNTFALITYTVLFLTFTFCIFMFCYIGQLLDNESNNVKLVTIGVDWYRLPIKKARYLVFIMAMSNYPTKLVAGKMLDMSLATFGDIMKMSFAYLNILRSIE